ncbi:hypothetical protein HWQ67_10500 [Candidatus Magnetobacterium casensis]|uniref:Uncharacterized protein n=2 Tax=Candidatus Magnetobacterium casense TaxID=1455061 RepID=A0ABS6RZD6_9BACT|nr:hypothetical protein [Candidatus Magnetobacterium casensis]
MAISIYVSLDSEDIKTKKNLCAFDKSPMGVLMDDEHYMEDGYIAVEERDNGRPVQETAKESVQEAVKLVELKVEIADILPLRQDKQNCWEYKLCGRQPGGKNADKFGICPVTTAEAFDGLHGGTNAGRACWAVAVPLADSDTKGGIANKIKHCTTCSFHQLVINQETEYQSAIQYMKKSKEEEKAKAFKEPGFLKHVYEKSKHTAFDDSFEVNSLFISLLIGWVSLCPSVSMLEGSKRLCKDDLVDELMVIDAIANHPRVRAFQTVAKTMLKAVRRQAFGYFEPLVKKIK